MELTDLARPKPAESKTARPSKEPMVDHNAEDYQNLVLIEREMYDRMGGSTLNVGDELSLQARVKSIGEQLGLEMTGMTRKAAEPDMKTYARSRNAELKER